MHTTQPIASYRYAATIIYDGSEAWKDQAPKGWPRRVWIAYAEGRVSPRQVRAMGLDLAAAARPA